MVNGITQDGIITPTLVVAYSSPKALQPKFIAGEEYQQRRENLYLSNKTNNMQEGVLIEKDNNGEPTSVTIDLKKHQDAIPALQELGFLEKKSFEERWENALMLEEAKEKTFQHIRNLFAKDGRS